MTTMNSCVAEVRKLLLEINYRDDCIPSALGHIAQYVKASSIFLEDMEGDDYDYVLPGTDVFLEDKEKKTYFISELFNYAKKIHQDHSVSIQEVEMDCNDIQDEVSPLFCEFLKVHDIEKIAFISSGDKSGHITLLGVINPRRKKGIKRLLADFAVCFSIALYNRRYLLEIEKITSTDSLTGVMNRTAYKRDVTLLKQNKPKSLACIYIDVNELHLFNNCYGHTEGDNMLKNVAETIKEFFGNDSIYRLGGDEFLVIAKEAKGEEIQKKLARIKEQLTEKKYYVSVGFAIGDGSLGIESLLEDAEQKMYKEKARYYLNKQKTNVLELATESPKHIVTGMKELDTLLTIMGQKYRAIYCVSLTTDHTKNILMSSYLDSEDADKKFSSMFKEYVHTWVHSNYHRDMLTLLDYDILKECVVEEDKVEIIYQKIDGTMMRLTVYLVENTEPNEMETLWVFEEFFYKKEEHNATNI